MKPWREIAVPHQDVLDGTFQQSEFAADISAVQKGDATPDYQNPRLFFQRTFITEGMAQLLTAVGQRLNGRGGDPVIQLQTAFGGGKTHTMLAVYHLASRDCSLKELQGMGRILDKAGLEDIPKARMAVIDGLKLGPEEVQRHGSVLVKTLWGELAWQIGGEEAFNLVKDSDQSGTAPGKDSLRRIFAAAGPCIILIDELVAFVRQFETGKTYSSGTYESILSFIQALTEAVKLEPKAVLLASLPDSTGAGEGKGQRALKDLENIFGRVESLWKPIATEEAFEIVRRRLFQNIVNNEERDIVCKAFADLYIREGAKLPSETQKTDYLNSLKNAYPIHPEVFSRLYEDWSTLPNFQKTRGTLQLMALVINRLWQDNNQDLMILPGALPLYDTRCQAPLVKHLNKGWEPVIEKDIDGERSEAQELDRKEPRFGAASAARRVARTIFLGTAPASTAITQGSKGLTQASILLGCLQPDQSSALYMDALNRLVDRWHYLSTSGDKTHSNTRFWFDTKANLRREMEERKQRFDEKKDVRDRLAKELRNLTNGSFFDSIHVFASHADIPDDSALKLVILSPNKQFSPQEKLIALTEIKDYLKQNGTRPRSRQNRLLFLAADDLIYGRLVDQVRTVLAWQSIVNDINDLKLNVDLLQSKQAKEYLNDAEKVLPATTRECFRWLLVPEQESPSDRDPLIEHHSISNSGTSFSNAIETICRDNEIVIFKWAAQHLMNFLKLYYWVNNSKDVSIQQFWEDSTKYLYLPRLKTMGVLTEAVQRAAETGALFGYALTKDNGNYMGLTMKPISIGVDPNGLLVEPDFAKNEIGRLENLKKGESKKDPVLEKDKTPEKPQETDSKKSDEDNGSKTDGSKIDNTDHQPPLPTPDTRPFSSFHGSLKLNGSVAKHKMIEVAEEILAHLAKDPSATVSLTLEIHADFPRGVKSEIHRIVSENSNNLNLEVKEWE